jgi:hypothetical protein
MDIVSRRKRYIYEGSWYEKGTRDKGRYADSGNRHLVEFVKVLPKNVIGKTLLVAFQRNVDR